jgi:hypothetical protein
MFLGQTPAAAFADLVNILAEDGAALLGEIDMLKNTMGGRGGAGSDEESAGDPVFIQGDNFTRFDIPNILCIDGIKGTCLAGDAVGTVFSSAQSQGANPIRITSCFDAVGK